MEEAPENGEESSKTDGRNVITLLKVSRVESGWNWLRVMPSLGFPYWRR